MDGIQTPAAEAEEVGGWYVGVGEESDQELVREVEEFWLGYMIVRLLLGWGDLPVFLVLLSCMSSITLSLLSIASFLEDVEWNVRSDKVKKTKRVAGWTRRRFQRFGCFAPQNIQSYPEFLQLI